MKAIGLILFVLLLLPIYALPWVSGLGSVVAAMDALDVAANPHAMEEDLVGLFDSRATVVAKIWIAEAICYVLLLATPLVFAKGARWTAALIAFAAVFDLVPILDFVPLVPTVMFVIAFVFMAKAQVPESRTTQPIV